MEVYQSSKTAEELEYALGAVPSIGKNGNWFIGEQDTGVFAGGVDVSGAEVGQTIVVAEVDPEGRPVSWVPADLVGDWKCALAFDSIDENVSSIVFDSDEKGIAFEELGAKEFYIVLNWRLTASSKVRLEYNGWWTASNYWTVSSGDWYCCSAVHIRQLDGAVLAIVNGSNFINGITKNVNDQRTFKCFEFHVETSDVYFSSTATAARVFYR